VAVSAKSARSFSLFNILRQTLDGPISLQILFAVPVSLEYTRFSAHMMASRPSCRRSGPRFSVVEPIQRPSVVDRRPFPCTRWRLGAMALCIMLPDLYPLAQSIPLKRDFWSQRDNGVTIL
jgi:hypothetical protein